MDADEIREEIAHQRVLMREYRKHQRLLEEQAANFGLHTPPHIQNEINEHRDRINDCENKIKEFETLLTNIDKNRIKAGHRDKRLILVVDDDPDNRAAAILVLTDAGYDVIEAGDGITGLQLATKEKPDLILVDLSLPIMDGWELIREIRRRKIPTKMLAFTAHVLPGDIERAMKCGADGIVAKPFDIEWFRAKIARTLELDDDML